MRRRESSCPRQGLLPVTLPSPPVGERVPAGRKAWMILFFGAALAFALKAAPTPPAKSLAGDQLLDEYFRQQTARLSAQCLSDIKSAADWQARRPEYRRQAAEMLGLDPLPLRTDLKPVITGKLDQDGITVEKLHFQSLPGLYVTANFYRPTQVTGPLPTILYVCGHGPVVSNKVSYGNKVSYQHHGIWFARHGYACLVIDTVQYGEIQGAHRGTYSEGQWWWNARGYSPAGVETWNSIRALDYLGTRPEVDTNRFGVTGRSGGGAYSWFLAATDERVKVIAPVAGITDLQNHVVDGVVEGHCDCMFFVNTYRWDYPALAALAAPRPLLLVNTDSDTIFPLDGVMCTINKVKAIYRLNNCPTNLGLVIGPGPHKDTQNLQIPVLRWFNQHLKGEDPVIEAAAVKWFKPEQLKVFTQLPTDAINTNVQAVFVPRAPASTPPASLAQWQAQTSAWMRALTEKVFAGWRPSAALPSPRLFAAEIREGVRYEEYHFESQDRVPLRLYLMRHADRSKPAQAVLSIASESHLSPPAAADLPATIRETVAAFGLTDPPNKDAPLFAAHTVRLCLQPRGIGYTEWPGDAKKQTQIRRRFMLLGQTLDAMRVWDIRCGIHAARHIKDLSKTPLAVEANDTMAVNAVYASLYEPPLAGLVLRNPPTTHMAGPDYLNVLKYLDLPEAMAMAAGRCPVKLQTSESAPWEFARATARNLQWPADRLVITP